MAELRIARSRARPAEYADALTERVVRLQAAKSQLAEATEQMLDAEKEVLTLLSAAGTRTATATLPDGRYRVTMVASERLDINEAGLRKAVSAPVFDKLCDLKLNRQKLEVAVAEGRVDPVLVSTHSTKRVNKAYVLLKLLASKEE